jgi:hypothetical protein
MGDLALPPFPIHLSPFSHWTQYLLQTEFPLWYNSHLTAFYDALQTAVPVAQFILLVAKNLFWFIELYSLISDEEIVFGEKNGMWSWAYLSRRWKAASYFKGMSADNGCQVCCQSQHWGEFAASAVHGVLALVSVTLGQQHLYTLPGGFSLGGLGFFGLRKAQLKGNVCIKDVHSLLLRLVYVFAFQEF